MFVKLLSYSGLRENSAKSVSVDGLDVAIFKVAGKIHAMKNVCPHQHFAMLHEGELRDGAVTCPMHGWTFDLETGASRTGQGKAKTYEVKIENDEIFVDLDA